MSDGLDNVCYFRLDKTHIDYDDFIAHFLALHIQKDANNTLEPIISVDAQEAIAKVVAYVGWIDEEATYVEDAETSGLILQTYSYNQLSDLHTLFATDANWE